MSQSASQPVIPVREFFTLDDRSLALFRVALALFLLLDWIDRLPDARILFSDEGILPRNLITGVQPISIHLLHGAAWFQALLMVVAMVFSLLLLVGWRTSWVCLVSFFLLISIHAHNPPLLQGGDHLLRLLLFWSIFLPLGARWSVDAARSARRFEGAGFLAPGSIAFILQLCLMYWFAAAWKWLGPWRDEGTAVYLALHVDHFPTRLGLLVREYPDLCWFLTHATIWLETLGPVMLFLPFNVGLQRMLAVASFILFHAGLALTMELGHFPFVCMIAWLPLVPSGFWNRLVPRLRSPGSDSLKLVVDPEQGKTARRLAYLRTFLFLDEIPLLEGAAQGGQLARLRKQGGWGLVDRDTEYFAEDALARFVACSPTWFPLTGAMRGMIGRRIQRWLSRAGSARLHEGSPTWAPPSGQIANTLVIFLLLYVVCFNVFTFLNSRARYFSTEVQAWLPHVPEQFQHFGIALGLDQGWGLFAPQPGRHVGWFIVAGQQKDGREVDVYHGGPLSWEKPDYLMLTYESGRWRKLRMNLCEVSAYPYLLPGWTQYYFNEWNRHHHGSQQLKSIEVWWMREVTVPPGELPPPPEKILLGRYTPPVDVSQKGVIVVLGERKDGSEIDLMRAGAVLDRDNPMPNLEVPIVNPTYPTIAGLAETDAAPFVLSGFAQYVLEEWNQNSPSEPIRRAQIVRVSKTPSGSTKRQMLAEAVAK